MVGGHQRVCGGGETEFTGTLLLDDYTGNGFTEITLMLLHLLLVLEELSELPITVSGWCSELSLTHTGEFELWDQEGPISPALIQFWCKRQEDGIALEVEVERRLLPELRELRRQALRTLSRATVQRVVVEAGGGSALIQGGHLMLGRFQTGCRRNHCHCAWLPPCGCRQSGFERHRSAGVEVDCGAG
eukprot:1438087-Rhodomonas_salina.1